MEHHPLSMLAVLEAFASPPVALPKQNQVVVYMAENEETQKYYIGATVNRSTRRGVHLRALKAGKHYNNKFQEAFDENNNFHWKEIPVETPDLAFKIEKDIIGVCRGDPNCLNLQGAFPSPCIGRKHSEETRAKIKESWRKINEAGFSHRPESVAASVDHLKKPVVAGGKRYDCQADAARAHGIRPCVVTQRIRSPYFTDWYSLKPNEAPR